MSLQHWTERMNQPLKSIFRSIVVAAALLNLCSPAAAEETDRFTIRLDESVAMESKEGRVILFFITETGPRWQMRLPIEAPFYERPQPIASVAVTDFGPGDAVVIDDGSAIVFGGPLSKLSGTARVQAIFDHDTTERSHEQGPGNVVSDVLVVELCADNSDTYDLVLKHVIPPLTMPKDEPDLKWVEFRSDMLSEFYGRDVFHRVGVALPPGYLEEDNEFLRWPAIYYIPGFGSRHTDARNYALMYRTPGIEGIAPQAVVIVLDPESPLGHHGFVDSPNHGPRGTALVEELIPHLEKQFRIVARPQARIVTGHSSGGWSSLWLQLQWPDVFGACWSSAPDPLDFRAFQMTNLYEDESVYETVDGSDTPSYRMVTGQREDYVLMTVRDEARMEYVLHPDGGSGQQWDAWMAMFSPKDQETGYPRRLFDPETGRIDREVAEHWKQFDIAGMVREDWDRHGPIVTERVRLVCGELDCFYLNRAVDRFAAMVQEKAGVESSRNSRRLSLDGGYVYMHEHATHSNIMQYITHRWNREMREHLRRYGYQE